MDAQDIDTDLDALRSAVLASIKLKNNSDIKPARTDSELEELRKAALLSTKKQNEALLSKSQPVPEIARKRSNRNTNLIVIQPLVNEEKQFSRSSSFTSQPIKLLRPQDAYCRLNDEKPVRSPETQPRPKGTDKFSRFESSSSSEDESDFSDSESASTSSDKQSNNNESEAIEEVEAENESDILLIQPDETFEDKFHEEANGENGEVKNSVKDNIVREKSASVNTKTVAENNNKCDADKRQIDSKYEGSKRRQKEDASRSPHKKHRKHDREDGGESGRDKRRHRRPREKDRKTDERVKERNETNSRTKSSEEKEKESGRVRLSSILSKPEIGDGRTSRSEIVRCKSAERSSGDRQDLRDKLQWRKRTNNEMKSEGEEAESPKRKSVGESEERRKKSKSPPIKSVLSVVKVGSESANLRKRTLENAQVTANGPSKSNVSGHHTKTSISPIRCEPSPERKVLIRSSRYPQTYSSNGDEVENSARVHITINEETGKSKDANINPPPKPKLPVHLRLGSAPSAANNTKKNSDGDTEQPHSLKIRDFDKKRKSVSPAKSSSTSTSSSSKRSDRKALSGSTAQARQVVKLSGDRVRSIATILSKQTDHLPTNQMQQLTGKTYENQLDEKIRRIRVKNQAIMKRKSEIEREQHSNG